MNEIIVYLFLTLSFAYLIVYFLKQSLKEVNESNKTHKITVLGMMDSSRATFDLGSTSVLNNPYEVRTPGSARTNVKHFKAYFYRNLNPDIAPPGFLEKLDVIVNTARVTDITLGCFSQSSECHCHVVKEYVENELKMYP